MGILRDHHAIFRHLVTIRAGEPVFNPVTNRVERAEREMVKVKGRGGSWCCSFYRREDSSCTIYDFRFLECRLLKCWDPSDLMRVMGRGTIRRSDVLNEGDPIRSVIALHDEECPLSELSALVVRAFVEDEDGTARRRLSDLIRRDSALRSYALNDLGVESAFELFLFGRTVRDIVSDAGLVFGTGRRDSVRQGRRGPDKAGAVDKGERMC